MTIAALLLALIALGYAFLTQRKLQDVTRRLSRTNSNLYELSAQMENLEEKLDAQSKELAFEIKKASGQISFESETTIAEVQAEHPFADQILASFHMGGCHSCAVEPEETIAGACERLDVSEVAFLAALRNGTSDETIPLNNIQLQL